MGHTGVIDAIAETITKESRLPIYVAEGKSINKLRKIYSIEYLTHCYERREEVVENSLYTDTWPTKTMHMSTRHYSGRE